MSQESVLILGSLNPIARVLVPHLLNIPGIGYIRGVDKRFPILAKLTPDQQAAFSRIDHVQSSLRSVEAVKQVSTFGQGEKFKKVFIFPLEIKPGQVSLAYESNNVLVAKCIAQAIGEGCFSKDALFIVVSGAAYYYAAAAAASTVQNSPLLSPLYQSFHEQEKIISAIPSISLIVLRTASIYGKGLSTAGANFLAMIRAKKHMGKPLQEFIGEDVVNDLVHIQDVVRACLHVSDWYLDTQKPGTVKLYNLSSPVNHSYRNLLKYFADYFGMEIEEATPEMQLLFKNISIEEAKEFMEEQNQLSCQAWDRLLRRDKIEETPVSCFIDQEMLINTDLRLDGSQITKETGFEYQYPQLDRAAVEEWIHWLQELKWFPLNHD